MSKKLKLPASARHIILFDEDWEFLETRFGPTGFKPLGVSEVLRAKIHNWILTMREAENQFATQKMREKIGT